MLSWFITEERLEEREEDHTMILDVHDFKREISPKLYAATEMAIINKVRVKKFLTHQAWKKLEKVLTEQIIHYCPSCQTPCLEDWEKNYTPSVLCESCIFWFHLHCMKLQSVPKLKLWFCKQCWAVAREKQKELRIEL